MKMIENISIKQKTKMMIFAMFACFAFFGTISSSYAQKMAAEEGSAPTTESPEMLQYKEKYEAAKAKYDALPDEMTTISASGVNTSKLNTKDAGYSSTTVVSGGGRVSISTTTTINGSDTAKGKAHAEMVAMQLAYEKKVRQAEEKTRASKRNQDYLKTQKELSAAQQQLKDKYGDDWRNKATQEENNAIVRAQGRFDTANSTMKNAILEQKSNALHEFNLKTAGKELTDAQKEEKKRLEQIVKNTGKSWKENASELDKANYDKLKSSQNVELKNQEFTGFEAEMQTKYGDDWKNKMDTDEKNKLNNLEFQRAATANSYHVSKKAAEAVSKKAAEAEMKGCNPSGYYETYKGCMFCDLFKVAFNTASAMAAKSFAALATPVATLVMMGMAIWLAVTVLSFVSSIETKDGKDLTMAIINQSFIVLLVFILLKTSSSQFFSLALEPIFNTGLEIARATVGGTEKCKDYGVNGVTGSGLPSSMGNAILCTLETVQNKIASVLAVGTSAMCLSWEYKQMFLPHWGYLITGLGLWVGGAVMLIAFPFLMLDSVLQLAVAAALLPAAIGAYAFKLTRKYVKKVWDTFLNAMFNFVFLSIVILILVEAMGGIITGATSEGLDDFVKSNQGSVNLILENLGWSGVAWLKIVFVLVLTWALLGKVNEFADEFSSSMVKGGIGSKIGGMAASFTKNAATKIGGASAGLVATGAKDMAKGTWNVGRSIAHNANLKRRDWVANNKLKNGDAKKNEDGSITYQSKSWLRRRDVEYTVKSDADGNRMVTRKKQLGNGKVQEKVSDAFMTVKSTKGRNGEVLKEKIKLHDSQMKNLVDKDGKVDVPAIMRLMEDSSLDKNVVAAAIVKKVTQGRFPYSGNAHNDKRGIIHRDVQQGTDSKGRNFIAVRETVKDKNGKIIAQKDYKMTFGVGEDGKLNGQLLNEFTNIDENGKGKTLATDGMMNKKTKFKAQNTGNGFVVDEASKKDDYSLDETLRRKSDHDLKNKYAHSSMFDTDEFQDAVRKDKIGKDTRKLNMYEFR